MDRWKMRSIGVVAVLALALGAGHLVRIHDRGTEGDGLAEGDAASFAEERRRPTVIERIKRRLRRRAAPTWRQYYLIYTKDATAPAWAKALTETSAIRGSFVTREENPTLFLAMPPVRRSDSEEDLLAGCQGAVELGAQYERDEKVFLDVARFTCQLAMRESGYLTSAGAYSTYQAETWLEDLREFSVEKLIGIHQVPEGEKGTTHWVHTHGLVQFELPELEIRGVPPDLAGTAAGFLNGMGEWMLAGESLGDGHTVESPYDSSLWAVCESIRADSNEGHGEPDYPVLRLSDHDPKTQQKSHGLTRFLRGLASESE